jgi:hypothetical protein
MAEFREILAAPEEKLVRLFYRIKPLRQNDFIAKINHTANQLGVNHSQLVCALGFNRNIRDLTDILSVVGFSSYKLLSYRRNELFSTDTYDELDVDNILDVYTERLEDAELLTTLRELLPARFNSTEAKISQTDDPSTIMSYKMEIHAVYAGGIATREFAELRMAQEIGKFRLMTDEIQMIIAEQLIPPSNLFFLDSLLPDEKKFLIDSGGVNDLMIRNRMQNTSITEDEREMLEGYI